MPGLKTALTSIPSRKLGPWQRQKWRLSASRPSKNTKLQPWTPSEVCQPRCWGGAKTLTARDWRRSLKLEEERLNINATEPNGAIFSLPSVTDKMTEHTFVVSSLLNEAGHLGLAAMYGKCKGASPWIMCESCSQPSCCCTAFSLADYLAKIKCTFPKHRARLFQNLLYFQVGISHAL